MTESELKTALALTEKRIENLLKQIDYLSYRKSNKVKFSQFVHLNLGGWSYGSVKDWSGSKVEVEILYPLSSTQTISTTELLGPMAVAGLLASQDNRIRGLEDQVARLEAYIKATELAAAKIDIDIIKEEIDNLIK